MKNDDQKMLAVFCAILALAILIFCALMKEPETSTAKTDDGTLETGYMEALMRDEALQTKQAAYLAKERAQNTVYDQIHEAERIEAERLEAERIEAERLATKAQAVKTYTPANTYSNNTAGVLTKAGGVNYYNGNRETWYSSNVLHHYRTSEWTAGSDGVYRDSDGYVVVASSDLSQGATVDTSLGMGKVYDSGCASGTIDVYVNW